MPGQVHVSVEDGIGSLVFDHAERRNAITGEMWDAIPSAVEALAKSAQVRVVVMRGAGELAFVSGADISEFAESRSGAAAAEYDRRNARAFRALTELNKPLIALIHGFCIGGGCAIALTADLRFSAEDGAFAIPAAKLGLGYHAAGLENLVNVVGQAAARELFFTARRIDASHALRIGLVNAVLPKHELDAHVFQLAREIADNAPLTLSSAKRVFGQLGRTPEARDHAAIDASILACYESADYVEGVRAFLDKRRAAFKGR